MLRSGLAAIAVAGFIPFTLAQPGFYLNQGESFAVPFTSLDFFAANTNLSSSLRASISFMPGLEAGESIQVEYFPDSSVQGVPFYTGSFTSPLTYADNITFVRPSTEWDDLDGGVRVTMLNGSALMWGAYFQVDRPGESYSRFQPVPEPRIASLLALGFIILLFRFRYNRSSPRPSRCETSRNTLEVDTGD